MPEPLTEYQLSTWEAMAEAAAPGPWTAHRQTSGMVVGFPERWVKFGTDRGSLTGEASIRGGITRVDENAAFIAEARTAVPALLAEVRHLREERMAPEMDTSHYHGICDGLRARDGALRAAVASQCHCASLAAFGDPGEDNECWACKALRAPTPAPLAPPGQKKGLL